MERWRQIESLFQEALQRDPAERDAWLREACHGDAGLQREVASLLANHNETTGALWAAAAAAQLIDAHASLKAGQRLGPYEILSAIGAGGMGEVYKARDTRLKRDVAIKICSAQQFSERFEREARAIAALNHPNICQLYDVGPNFLVMELVEGENLAGSLPVDTALNYARQIAEALEAAHEKGIVHRDLKPANIKITPAGVVKVLDFGLAKAAEEPPAGTDPANAPTLTMSPTRAGTILGTAPYMAPEQARGATVDKRADIWAFGCVLYEMLTGRHTFEGETESDTLAAVLRAGIEWDRLPANTPLRVRRLLERCLERDPKRRLRDIGDAWIELERTDEPAPVEKTWGIWQWVPWALAALLGAALLAVTWTWLHPPQPAARPVTRWTVPLSQSVVTIALSRDGTRVAIGGGGTSSPTPIVLRMLDEFEGRPLAGTEGGGGPAFSPDGQWIAYLGPPGKLKKVPVTGGASITLCDCVPQSGRTWGEDGTIVYGSPKGLMRVSAAGGTPQALTTLDAQKGERAHGSPQFLPGGHAIIFTIGGINGSQIAALDLKKSNYRVVVNAGSTGRYVPTGHLVYVRDGTMLAAPFDAKRLVVTGSETPVIEGVYSARLFAEYAFSESGLLVYVTGGQPADSRTLEWVDRKGGTQPLTVSPRGYTAVRLSPDVLRAATSISDFENTILTTDIWILELERGTLTRLTSEGRYGSPVWTPDGRRVTFASTRGKFGIHWAPADGGGKPELLLASETAVAPTSWTPDGNMLLYSHSQLLSTPLTMQKGDIWALSMPGARNSETKPHLLLQTSFNEFDAQVSPDGRWVAYQSDESRRSEVYVRPFPGPGGKMLISTEGGADPRWSRSGRELFYVNSKRQLMAVDIETRQAFRVGHPQPLFELPSPYWDVASDGKRFLVSKQVGAPVTGTKLEVVMDWFDELRRRVPAERK